MNNPYNVPNAERQHFRNALKSKLFLAFAILSTVYASLSVIGLIVSSFASAFYGNFTLSGVLYPILSIIATVGLFTAYSAAKSGDGERIVSGLKMSKCYIATIVITLVIGYIVSICLIVFSGALAFIGEEIADLVPSDIFNELTPDMEEFFSEFGSLTTAVIALIFFVTGLIMLALCILGSVYRKGISKAVKAAINSETTESVKPKISGFSIVFGYILGVILVLNALSFNSLLFHTLLGGVVGIIEAVSTIVLGAMIFIFSLILSSLRSNLSRVTPAVQRNCPKCGSPMPAGAAFCMHCGASPYTAPQAAEAPVNNSTPNTSSETAQSETTTNTETPTEEAPSTVYCTSCGKPMPSGQAFCTNCGFKLK